MSYILPEINQRSYTPFKKAKPTLNNLTHTSRKKIIERVNSLTPYRNSTQQKGLPDFDLKPRPISDEQMTPIKDSFLLKFSSIFPQSIKSKPKLKSVQNTINKNYSEVVEAIFSIYKCQGSKISASNLVSLFVSTGFCENSEQIIEIFTGINEGLSLNMIWFTRDDILKICKDQKTENILRALIREAKCSDKPTGVQKLLVVVKKWWNKLPKNELGIVVFEEMVQFCSEIGVVETSADIKRVFLRMSQNGNFKQFSGLFSRSLFKFLVNELADIVEKGSALCLTAEFAIISYRRKRILESLEGYNKVIDAMAECSILNNMSES